MLQSLKIQNVALIPQVEIEFEPRFNVMSGETGAGKSIIVGSFQFILGEKLKPTVIRSGESFAKVNAVFCVLGSELEPIAKITGIEFDDNTVILTRTLKSDGRSECRINGNVVTVAILKEAAAHLIHIHGQHDTEVLLRPKNHIEILDAFGSEYIPTAKAEYTEEFERLRSYREGLKSFGGTDAERDRMVDMYTYQINEIENARLKDGEEEELVGFKQKMMNFEKISNGLSTAAAVFQSENGVGFGHVVTALVSVANLDSKLEKILEAARAVQYDIDEVSDSIMNYLDSLEYDEEKFRAVDMRLDEIKILKRKYGSSIPQIFAFLADARASLDFLTKSVDDIEQTKKRIAAQESIVRAAGAHLTEARRDAADRFSGEMIRGLSELGIERAQVVVSFKEITPMGNGCDEVEFLFSANAGEAVRPLANIISGGEMSRFMLALKSVTARIGNVSTLVFDEIDTGIGGTMGTRIAEKIQALSKFHQVIVVTHLPQIAAMADTHFKIAKSEVNGKTITNITKLTDAEQVRELARMVGSAADSESAQQHAEALKKWAKGFKSSL